MISRDDLGRTYDDAFFHEYGGEARTSAEVVVPIVIDLLHPASVLDVGCGRGEWLAVFRDHGVDDVLGVDGPHVALADVAIPRDQFRQRDLAEPLDLDRRFDLAMSLEVAEHLDASHGPALVAALVAHAPAVLFSAAVPFQGGAGHVNERWPSYWAAQFAEHGYVALDVVRPRVWDDERVSFWYAQNTLLYCAPDHPLVAATQPAAREGVRDLVHPRLHVRDHTTPRRSPAPPSLSRVLRDLAPAAARAVRRRAHRREGGT